jgi:hypothetical protein
MKTSPKRKIASTFLHSSLCTPLRGHDQMACFDHGLLFALAAALDGNMRCDCYCSFRIGPGLNSAQLLANSHDAPM